LLSSSRGGRVASLARADRLFCLRQINPAGKSPKTCPALRAKIFRFAFHPNHLPIRRRPVPLSEGRLAIVTNAGRDAVDAGGALDEGAGMRTAKSCGPDAPTLASSSRGIVFRESEGGKKARSPGRARRKPLKPLRGECRVFPGVLVVTNACAFYTTHAAIGRIGRPAFPAPSEGRARKFLPKLGRITPRDREDVFGRHCEEPTGRANARPMTGSATKQSTLSFLLSYGLLRIRSQ
jgi:hypothetical protein